MEDILLQANILLLEQSIVKSQLLSFQSLLLKSNGSLKFDFIIKQIMLRIHNAGRFDCGIVPMCNFGGKG